MALFEHLWLFWKSKKARQNLAFSDFFSVGKADTGSSPTVPNSTAANSRGFGMQQTERRRTDLARSTYYNIQKKINTRKIEAWQSSTHRKCQTEEVHLLNC